MAFNGIPFATNKDAAVVGRAGKAKIVPRNGVYIEGLWQFLNDLQKADDRFNTEMQRASMAVAKDVTQNARRAASTVQHNRQALEASHGLQAHMDRVPTIKLSQTMPFQSLSRSKVRGSRGRLVNRKVKMRDVFFGAEFGGGKKQTTKQFPPHRGKGGYFFWPTVRKMRNEIAEEYLNAIERVMEKLGFNE
jgi:hypothetical protein